jgi:hypothetical protein
MIEDTNKIEKRITDTQKLSMVKIASAIKFIHIIARKL